MTSTALACHDVSLAYGSTEVVRAVSLTMRPGEVTALIGPNGSGKSTLLRGIARLHGLKTGRVTLHAVSEAGSAADVPEVAVGDLSPRALATRLTVLSQSRPTPGGITVAEAVGFGRHPHRSRISGRDPRGREAVERALSLTGLTDLTDHAVDALSGGQVQRVWLASCLAQETAVLLLDEPTNHLDLRHQVDLLGLLRDLAEEHGVTVGVVLHDLDHAAVVADRLVLLDRGQVVAQGGAHEVLTPELLTQVYRVPVDVHHDPASGERRISATGALRRRRSTTESATALAG